MPVFERFWVRERGVGARGTKAGPPGVDAGRRSDPAVAGRLRRKQAGAMVALGPDVARSVRGCRGHLVSRAGERLRAERDVRRRRKRVHYPDRRGPQTRAKASLPMRARCTLGLPRRAEAVGMGGQKPVADGAPSRQREPPGRRAQPQRPRGGRRWRRQRCRLGRVRQWKCTFRFNAEPAHSRRIE